MTRTIKRVSNSRSTIDDVALEAEVSTATVSRVLTGEVHVSEETAKRVIKAVEKLGYVPQSAARNLARRKTKTIGLILPSLAGDFFSLMLTGVEAAVTEEGYDLLVTTQQESNGNLPAKGLPLGKQNTDGLLVFVGNLTPTLLQYHSSGFPMVLLYQSSPMDQGIPCVTIENKNGTRQLIDHLIETHECRKIAFVRGSENNEDSYWREQGYRKALEEHHIPFDPDLVTGSEFTEQVGVNAVRHFLGKGIKMDAIFGGSDESAIGVLLELKQQGIRVPEEIKVVGFDDLTLARYISPHLTTVRAPTENVGRVAARKLIEIIQQRKTDDLTLLPTELIIRQSCGCL
jgi:DNA-binding LacI/PurR family transcriptional regulator